MAATIKLSKQVGIIAAGNAMQVSRSSLYRAQDRLLRPPALKAAAAHPRALSVSERTAVLAELCSEKYVDVAPAAAYAMMLECGRYLCSVRTMYRILHDSKAVRERRALRRHPVYTKPELLAQRPNEVWSWDITKLYGPGKWEYFHLYVMLDIFSRFVVGWMICDRESGSLAHELIATCCQRQDIRPHQLGIHSDRGAAMISRPVVGLLHELDVHKTVSRPHVSNDNPYSESQFKTMKYRPNFPRRFGCLQDARSHLRPFFSWYNTQHRHSKLGYMTPESVHLGHAKALQQSRGEVLQSAYALRPQRFVRGMPRPPSLPTAAWINPPKASEAAASFSLVSEQEILQKRV